MGEGGAWKGRAVFMRVWNAFGSFSVEDLERLTNGREFHALL